MVGDWPELDGDDWGWLGGNATGRIDCRISNNISGAIFPHGAELAESLQRSESHGAIFHSGVTFQVGLWIDNAD